MDLTLFEQELRRDEGVEREPYLDTEGHPTVGIGFNLDANPLPEGMTYPLSDENISLLFDISTGWVFASLDKYLPWWKNLDEVRQRVLANMCFNMGIYRLLGFNNTLTYMKNGDYANAAINMRKSKWYGQVGNRSKRLCAAMETGVMPDE